MSVEASLSEFKETEGGESFRLQHSKCVKVELAGETIQAKLGSMVAYQGDVKFEHAGSGGLTRMAKKAMTGEGASLMKISGKGEVFLADFAQDVQLLKLDNESITVNGANLLAFDADIDWDIKKVEGVSGMLGGGLYNTELKGSGYVAIISDGTPILLEVDGDETFADPQAAITWSSGLSTGIKTNVSAKNLIGRGSGESIQMSFSGKGWLLIQPSRAAWPRPRRAAAEAAVRPVRSARCSGGRSQLRVRRGVREEPSLEKHRPCTHRTTDPAHRPRRALALAAASACSRRSWDSPWAVRTPRPPPRMSRTSS